VSHLHALEDGRLISVGHDAVARIWNFEDADCGYTSPEVVLRGPELLVDSRWLSIAVLKEVPHEPLRLAICGDCDGRTADDEEVKSRIHLFIVPPLEKETTPGEGGVREPRRLAPDTTVNVSSRVYSLSSLNKYRLWTGDTLVHNCLVSVGTEIIIYELDTWFDGATDLPEPRVLVEAQIEPVSSIRRRVGAAPKFKRFYSALSLEEGLLTTSDDHQMYIWDPGTGSCLIEGIEGHSDWVNDAVTIGDDGMLISASNDGTLRIWQRPYNAGTGRVGDESTN